MYIAYICFILNINIIRLHRERLVECQNLDYNSGILKLGKFKIKIII